MRDIAGVIGRGLALLVLAPVFYFAVWHLANAIDALETVLAPVCGVFTMLSGISGVILIASGVSLARTQLRRKVMGLVLMLLGITAVFAGAPHDMKLELDGPLVLTGIALIVLGAFMTYRRIGAPATSAPRVEAIPYPNTCERVSRGGRHRCALCLAHVRVRRRSADRLARVVAR